MRFAIVSERALRKVSACALPRPSAMASAKFANSTVNHSHKVICRLNLNASCGRMNSSTVVITLPISTTNMTGLPIILRGFSLSSELQVARRTIFQSQTDLRDGFAIVSSESLPDVISRCSRIGPRLSAGKNVSAPTMMITPISSTVNSGVVTGNVPSDGGTYFFLRQIAGNRQHGDDHQKAADQHRDAGRDVVPGRVYVSARQMPNRCFRPEVKA